jgi:hypothetical protein
MIPIDLADMGRSMLRPYEIVANRSQARRWCSMLL